VKLTVPAIRAAEERHPSEASQQAKKLLDDIDALLAEILSPAVATQPAGV
jgi:hypothetical protein